MLDQLKRVARKTSAYRTYQQKRALVELRLWSPMDQSRLDFYAQFLDRGDIAFDVGANMGNRARIFRMLCRQVIAIEPQRTCIDVLSRAFAGDQRFTLVTDALGAAEGEAQMNVSDAHTLSTLSTSWISAVKSSGRFADQRWTKTQPVHVTTLDKLIERHGVPAFIKIDVEGFEDQVLAGLSRPVRAISFEFTPERWETTKACLDHLHGLGKATFNYGLGETMKLVSDTWMSHQQISERILAMRDDHRTFGDIYVRFADVPQGGN